MISGPTYQPPSMKSVSIIVPTYRDEGLHECVQSLLAQDYPGNLEILVVNNDPDHPVALPDPRVRVIEEAVPGSYAARNSGLDAATGEIVAFTDSDCIAEPDWISKAVAAIDATGADRIAGEVRLFRTRDFPSLAEMYEISTGFNQRRNASNGVSVTANLVATRNVFSHVGKFDSGLLSGGDIEWNQRATRAGYSIVYAPDAIVLHPARATVAELMRKARRIAGGRLSMKTRRELKLIRLAIPSPGLIKDILVAKTMHPLYKPPVILLAFFLRLYAFACGFLIYIGIASPQRS